MTPSNNWGLHIRGSHSKTDGYRDFGSNNSHSFALKTGYKFNEKSYLTFTSLTGYHRNGQGWLGNSLEELKYNKRANGNVKDDTDEFLTTMNVLQYKGLLKENLVLTSSLYFQMQDGSYRMDLDNYMRRMVDKNFETTGMLYDYALTYYMYGINTAVKYYLDDFELTTGINGYNYIRKHFDGNKGRNMTAEDHYSNVGDKLDLSVFGITKYNFTDNFNIDANIQYRFVNFTYEDKLHPEYKWSTSENGTRWNFINYGFGAEYKPINPLKIYGRFNYVNREPTRSDMFGGNENAIYEDKFQLVTTKNESVGDFEVGTEYVTGPLKFNVNYFYMKFKNELVLNGEFGLNGLPEHENAKSSVRTGIETTVDWNVFSNLYFENSFSFSDNTVNTETFGKHNHIMSPSTTWNTDLSWKAKNWTVGANYNYRSKLFIDMNNAYDIPEHWTINMYGNVRLKNVELGLSINNLTNRTNYTNGAVGAENVVLYFPDASTNYFSTVKIYF